MEKPSIGESLADNGEHSHWVLYKNEDGVILWSEDPEENPAIQIIKDKMESIRSLKPRLPLYQRANRLTVLNEIHDEILRYEKELEN